MILLVLTCWLTCVKDSLQHVDVETKVLASDFGATPFWIRSLQYGSVPMQGPTVGLRVNANRTYATAKTMDWRYGFEGSAWAGKRSYLFLTEAFISGKWKGWELWGGRKKEVYGLGDSTLSSGFYAWSGNALPMPKIQVSTRDYLPLFKRWVGLHMTYSHGWFDGTGMLKNAYLHQKSLYGRIGLPDSRFQLFGGLNHQVHWGGERVKKSTAKRVINTFPSSLNAYFYVVTVLKNRNWVGLDENTTSDDLENQYGNHLGSIDLAAKYRTRWGEILAYRQTAYEHGAVFNLSPADDGLTGLSFRFKEINWIDGFVFEHLYTGNQGSYQSWMAKLFNLKDTHYGEHIEYFYNGVRSSGWRYLKDEIGTPLLMMDSKSTLMTGEKFTYNAVNGLYLGIQGHLRSDIRWQFRGSRTLSYFIRPSITPSPRFIQHSYGLRIVKSQTDRLQYQLALGYDQGDRLEGIVGGEFSVKYAIF
jgi:hypothetical protein